MSSYPDLRKPIDLAIIGGGIGGTALAVALTRLGVPYTLYEAASAFSTTGAGVGLGPNAMRAMEMIFPAFQQAYRRISSGNVTPGKRHVMMDAMMIEEGFGEKQGLKPLSWGAPCYHRTSAHRKDLLDLMTDLIPTENVRFSMRCKSVQQVGDKVKISFEGGQTVEADTVIGCDGVKSLVRGAVLGDRYPELVPAQYTGRYAYRAIIPMRDAMEITGKDCLGCEISGDSRMFMGKKCLMVMFPIQNGRACNVVAFMLDKPWTAAEWTLSVTKEFIKEDMLEAGVDPSLVKLLEWARPMVQWAIHDHPVTPTYYNGRICLLGDSAHATTPHQGAGAGQCTEDALILSTLLALVSSPDQLETAFAVYDGIRRPRAQKVVMTSREAGDIFSLKGPNIGEDLEKLVDNMNKRFLWLWEHDLLGDVRRAKDEFLVLTGQSDRVAERKGSIIANVETAAMTA